MGTDRVFQLREHGDSNYLLSVDGWEPCYDGTEGFWFPESLHWIMYASHENSMTTGGILTDAIFRCWPGASEHFW